VAIVTITPHIPSPDPPAEPSREMARLRAVPSDPERSSEVTKGDRVLMERIHAGDQEALGELLRQYWNPLVSYALRFLGSRDDAEDVVQEALMGIWNARGNWTPTSRLQGFLYRAVRNLALNEQKSRKARRGREDLYHAFRTRKPPRTPQEVTQEKQLERVVAGAVDSLPPRRREVFVLSRYHGLTYGEIADAMDISSQTVANQMSAALDEVRERLEPELRAMKESMFRVIPGGAAPH